MTDAVQSSCCKVLCCQECSRGCRLCPNCRKVPVWNVNVPIRRLIDNMPSKCDNVGCTYRTTHGELKVHLQKCGYVVIKCKNQGCSSSFPRSFEQQHEQGCKFRNVLCQSCSQWVRWTDAASHPQVCPMELILCSLGCTLKIRRRDLRFHTASCNFRILQCSHCQHTYRARDSEDHQSCATDYEIVRCTTCLETMKRLDFQSHHCVPKMSACSFCGNEVLLAKLDQHEQSVGQCEKCEARIRGCKLEEHRRSCFITRCELCRVLLHPNDVQKHKFVCLLNLHSPIIDTEKNSPRPPNRQKTRSNENNCIVQ